MKKERSDTVIMVKNIPHTTQEADLREMFGKYGDLLRVVIPPTKTIALVEYSTANEAKAGFKAVAYRNYKGKPLLLEKAPVGVFTRPPPPKQSAAAAAGDENDGKADETAATVAAPVIMDQVFNSAENDDGTASATLYVKNLNFTTTSDALSQLFSTVDGFRTAKVSTKKSGDRTLSMGFGFVEFRDHQSATKAMKAFQNTQLDGHSLIIRFSDRSSLKQTASSNEKKPAEAKSTKLMVRNVPFEATRKDIVALFGAYGQLKRVRLPKKFDNSSHRGFAFVEFLTKQQAKLAYESLAATHLYGRHLVIEWAKDEDSVESLREKTKRQFDTDKKISAMSGKKQKIDIGEIGNNNDSDGDSD
jgi:multiple RNA-binding domain-containing protein 1